uniref:Putative ovule protein n=1 Tax=Solanum chacoense TaxID=4108 RepID=A0A0V0GRN0_SOLCH
MESSNSAPKPIRQSIDVFFPCWNIKDDYDSSCRPGAIAVQGHQIQSCNGHFLLRLNLIEGEELLYLIPPILKNLAIKSRKIHSR